jgi:phage terminase large subunit-like protein
VPEVSEQGTFFGGWEPTGAGRWGNKNSARKVRNTSKPDWLSWAPESLTARAIRWMTTYCIPRKGHGAGQPLKLARYQTAWLEEVLSGDYDAAGLTLPRGQGKSTFAGAVGVWATFDQVAAEAFGGQPQVPVIATNVRQARKGVYGSAVSFVKMHPELETRSIIYTAAGDERILVPGNLDAEMFIAPDDVDDLQGLDPSVALVDEFGFIKPEVWDAVLLAVGKRPRSLILGLGTRSAGTAPNALDQLQAQLDEHGSIPRFHWTDYKAPAGCPKDDRQAWHIANPALEDGFLRESALETALRLSPEAVFRLFRLNQKVDSITGWLGEDGPTLWRELGELGANYEWSSAPTWVGVDVSLHRDSTAVAWCQERPDGLLQIAGRIWSPGLNMPIPFDELRALLRELHETLNLARVSYDPRFMASIAQDLAEDGLPMVETPQSHARMAPYVGETYQRIIARQVVHEVPANFTAQVLAAVPYVGDTTGFTLSKKKSGQHIDGAVATCLAVGPAVLDVTDPDLTMEMLEL